LLGILIAALTQFFVHGRLGFAADLVVGVTPKSASWCFLMLEHLDEFAKLLWYFVADGKLVEDTFARTIAKLDMTAFESSIPALVYSQARDVLITQAITVLSDARSEED
jgi:hypothetical protein